MFQWRWYSIAVIMRLRKHKEIRIPGFIGGVWDRWVEREGIREVHYGI